MEQDRGTLSVYLQYYEREINLTRVLQKAYSDSTSRIVEPVTELQVYVKTEDEKAYYVANHKYESHVNLWDSQNDLFDTADLKDDVDWKSDVKWNLIFEYRGKQCDCEQIIQHSLEKFRKIYTNVKIEDFEVYVRQENETAYYVINGRYTGSVFMYM